MKTVEVREEDKRCFSREIIYMKGEDLVVTEHRTFRTTTKKVLEHDDRFITTKCGRLSTLTLPNSFFFVGTNAEQEHNIFTVEYGNKYFENGFATLEELSDAIVEEFDDFKVVHFEDFREPEELFQ